MEKRNTHVCGMAITLVLVSISLTALGETTVLRHEENAEPTGAAASPTPGAPTSGTIPQTNFALIGKQAVVRSTIETFVNKGPFNEQQKAAIFTSLGKPKINGVETAPDAVKKIEDLVNNAPNLSAQQKSDLLKQINENLKEGVPTEVAQGVAKSFADNPPTKAGQPGASPAPGVAAAAGQQGGQQAGGQQAGGAAGKAEEAQKAVAKQLEETKAKLAKLEEEKGKRNGEEARNSALQDALSRLGKNNQGQNADQGRGTGSGDTGGQQGSGQGQSPQSNQAQNDTPTPKKEHGNKDKGKSEPLSFGDSKGSDKNDNQNAKNGNDKKDSEPVIDMGKFAAKKDTDKKENKAGDALENLKKEFEEKAPENATPEVGDLGGGGSGLGAKLANLGPSSVPQTISQGGGGSAADIGSTFGINGDGGGGGGFGGGPPVLASGGGGGGGGGGAFGEFPNGVGGGDYGGGAPSPKFSGGTSLYTTSSGSSSDGDGGDDSMGDGNYEGDLTPKKKPGSVAEEVFLATRTRVKETRPGPFGYVAFAHPFLESRPMKRTVIQSGPSGATGLTAASGGSR